ncbi:hypothetical protein BDZ91DRAFT_724727 [Kalaharituber pfeilii]|nr:hypothetical protein BDZ91DRAFT_724727 [Kalaharituber pfeilii]
MNLSVWAQPSSTYRADTALLVILPLTSCLLLLLSMLFYIHMPSTVIATVPVCLLRHTVCGMLLPQGLYHAVHPAHPAICFGVERGPPYLHI